MINLRETKRFWKEQVAFIMNHRVHSDEYLSIRNGHLPRARQHRTGTRMRAERGPVRVFSRTQRTADGTEACSALEMGREIAKSIAERVKA